MNAPRDTTSRAPRLARAFTLVELLVVIGILAILISIAIGVGAFATGNANANATKGVLASLNRALEEASNVTGAVPGYVPAQYVGVPGEDAVLSTYQGGEHPRRPDAAVFVSQVQGIGEAGSIINNLPERFRFARTGSAVVLPGIRSVSPETPSIIDAWGDSEWSTPYDAKDQHLIYYVHPDNPLAQDLFGRCVNGMPYFVSAGPDGLYGLNDDDYIPNPDTGAGAGSSHTYETVLKAQKDNLYSYPVEPITESAFNRTDSAGVR